MAYSFRSHGTLKSQIPCRCKPAEGRRGELIGCHYGYWDYHCCQVIGGTFDDYYECLLLLFIFPGNYLCFCYYLLRSLRFMFTFVGIIIAMLIFTRVSAINVDVYGCYECYPWYFIGLLLLLLIFSGTVITIVDILPVSLPLLFIYPETTTVSWYLHRWSLLLLTIVTAVIHVYMDYNYLQLTSSCIIIVSAHVS